MWLEVKFEAANPDRVGTFRRKTSECEANYNRADARSRPPKKTKATSGGHFPEKIMLTKPVRAESNWGPDSRHSTKSRICCGRRPSGPPAEPAGKDRMVRRTLASPLLLLLLFINY